MLIAGMSLQQKQADDLLTILADPKKNTDIIKTLKAENAKLAKLRRELIGVKSLRAFCELKEKEANEEAAKATTSIAEVEKAKQDALAAVREASQQLQDTTALLNEKEARLKKTALDLDLRAAANRKVEEALAEYNIRANSSLEAGLALQDEYSDKLADLKERMRGL